MFPWVDKFLPSVLAPWRKIATDFTKYYNSIGEEVIELAMESGKKGISSWAHDVKTSETLQKQIAATSLTTGPSFISVLHFSKLIAFSEMMALELVQAASETTWTVLLRFVSAWAIYPEQMKAAQAEMDRVVGTERFPTFEDRPNLPLIEAVCRGESCNQHHCSQRRR